MAARKLVAIAELFRRNPEDGFEPAPGQMPLVVHEFTRDQLALALGESRAAADAVLTAAWHLATRLGATLDALRDGVITRGKAELIVRLTQYLSGDEATAVEAKIVGRAGRLTPGGLRSALARAVMEVAPEKARERREAAAKTARVERWAEDSGNAALMGRELPPDEVLACDQQISWRARPELRHRTHPVSGLATCGDSQRTVTGLGFAALRWETGDGRAGRRDSSTDCGQRAVPRVASRPRAGDRGTQDRVRRRPADQRRVRAPGGPRARVADLCRTGRGHQRSPRLASRGRADCCRATQHARPDVGESGPEGGGMHARRVRHCGGRSPDQCGRPGSFPGPFHCSCGGNRGVGLSGVRGGRCLAGASLPRAAAAAAGPERQATRGRAARQHRP